MPSQELKVTEIDAATGIVLERAASSQEAKDYNAIIESQLQLQAQFQAKATAKESALAKLAAIGLTEEEIAAL